MIIRLRRRDSTSNQVTPAEANAVDSAFHSQSSSISSASPITSKSVSSDIIYSEPDSSSSDPSSSSSASASASSDSSDTDTAGSTIDGFPIPAWGADAPAGSTGSTELNHWAIAGITIGIIVLIAIMSGIIWSIAKHKRKRRKSLGTETLVGDDEDARKGQWSRSQSRDHTGDRDSWITGSTLYGGAEDGRIRRDQRQGSADTYVDSLPYTFEPAQTVHPEGLSIALHDLSAARGDRPMLYTTEEVDLGNPLANNTKADDIGPKGERR